MYVGPVVSRRQMDVLHRGHSGCRFPRLAAALSRRRTSAVDAIRRERGRRARDDARWQIVHHHRPARNSPPSGCTTTRQATSRSPLKGYSFLPALSPDGKKVYYLRRVTGSHSYFSGELWVSDLATGAARTALCGFSAHAFLNIAGWEKSSVRDRTGSGPIGNLGRLA